MLYVFTFTICNLYAQRSREKEHKLEKQRETGRAGIEFRA